MDFVVSDTLRPQYSNLEVLGSNPTRGCQTLHSRQNNQFLGHEKIMPLVGFEPGTSR